MKYKFIFSLLLAGSAALPSFAQGYRDGIEYYKADRVVMAEDLLKRNLNNADTDKAATYYYLGLIDIDRYNTNIRYNRDGSKALAEAADYFNKGFEANPKYPFNLVGLGEVALIKGDSKAAEKYFNDAKKLGNKDAGVLAAIARAYYNVNPNIYAKQMNKYLDEAKKLVVNREVSGKGDFKENDADYYMFLGDMAFDSANGDSKLVGDACNLYEAAIRINPKAGEGYVKYADKFFTIKKNDYAISKLQEMLQANPNSALGQRELAERLYEDGQVAKAIAGYGTLVNNPNHFPEDETRYLALLYFANDYEKGFNEATKMLQKDAENFNARRFQYIFANLSGKENTLPMAEELLRRKSPQHPFATGDYSMIATELVKNGRVDDALAVIDMGIKDYPEEPIVLKGVADTYQAAEMFDKATDAFQTYMAAQNKKNGSDSMNDLWTLSYLGYVAGAKATDPALREQYWVISSDAANKAKDLMAPESKYVAAKRVADIAYYSNKTADAIKGYEETVALMEANNNLASDTDSAKAVYRALTLSYYNNKDMANAKKYYDKYYSLEPNDADLNKIAKAFK